MAWLTASVQRRHVGHLSETLLLQREESGQIDLLDPACFLGFSRWLAIGLFPKACDEVVVAQSTVFRG